MRRFARSKTGADDQTLRTLHLDGTPWFVAADVCRCLGLDLTKGTNNHTRRLADDERRTVTPSQIRGLRGVGATAVSESGLYKLIMRSDKPEARTFQDWVTREVLSGTQEIGHRQLLPTFGGRSMEDITLRVSRRAPLGISRVPPKPLPPIIAHLW